MKSLIKPLFLFVFAGLLSPLGVQAQTPAWAATPWTSSGNSVTFGVDIDGTLLATGAPTSLLLNTTEAATSTSQLLWVPYLSALRAGFFSSAASATTMGQYSVAFGHNSTASGEYSLATGIYSEASGTGSVALGWFASATNFSATAFSGSSASGSNSTAFGGYNEALGSFSTATGFTTTATAVYSFTMGTYNTGAAEPGGSTPSSTVPASTDPIFEIGNGTSAPSDAMVVYRDGNAAFQGAVSIPQSGDIPMYPGN